MAFQEDDEVVSQLAPYTETLTVLQAEGSEPASTWHDCSARYPEGAGHALQHLALPLNFGFPAGCLHTGVAKACCRSPTP